MTVIEAAKTMMSIKRSQDLNSQMNWKSEVTPGIDGCVEEVETP